MVKWSSGDSENWPKTENNKINRTLPGKEKILKPTQKQRCKERIRGKIEKNQMWNREKRFSNIPIGWKLASN